MFASDARYIRMLARFLPFVQNLNWAVPGRDHSAVGEGDPLIAVLGQQRIADPPIMGFVFTPIRVNLFGNIKWQAIGNALHGELPQTVPHHQQLYTNGLAPVERVDLLGLPTSISGPAVTPRRT